MKNEEKFNFIKEKLNEAAEEMPNSLKAENIVLSLEDKAQETRIKAFEKKRIIALAAVLAITLVSIFAFNLNREGGAKIKQNESDYSDIINYFEKLKNARSLTADESSYASKAGDTAIMEPTAKSDAKLPTAYGKTNTQVDGVDEADIIKNDGEYLYFVRGKSVLIYRESDLKCVSKIKMLISDKEVGSIYDIYVSGDRLVIISGAYFKNTGRYYYRYDYLTPDVETRCHIYDIRNREKPELIFTQTQSGSYSTSRLCGNVLYTVSDYSAYIHNSDESEPEDVIPKVNGEKIKRSSITFDEKNGNINYVVVSACDISDSKCSNTSYAYLGGYSEDCYCNNDTLYISSCFYPDDKKMKQLSLTESCLYTEICAVSLSKENISFKTRGIVKGGLLNQLAMDEYNGYFRCATTSYNEKTLKSESNLYVLSSDLKTVGKAENLKDGEEVKSVRFTGDTAYIVTYENTDPLFIIDLSSPNEPKITGKVELPGFSAYLHQLDGKYLVGIGDGGDDSGSDDSLKVTLFDISEKNNPKVCDSFKIREADTEIDYNFKAFVYYPEKQLIGIPVMKNIVTRESFGRIQSYIFLKNENGKLVSVNTYMHDKHMTFYDEDYLTDGETEYIAEFFRGTYTGETLYTLSERKLCAFDIESAEKLNEAAFADKSKNQTP